MISSRVWLKQLWEYNLDGVRQISMDEVRSALRFIKATFIKHMTRKLDAFSETVRKLAGQI
jgi:hypothetical protein